MLGRGLAWGDTCWTYRLVGMQDADVLLGAEVLQYVAFLCCSCVAEESEGLVCVDGEHDVVEGLRRAIWK